ncbi:hypothetical protein [Thiolapillus sp.]
MHDAVEAKIQFWLIKLKQLFQQVDQAFALFFDVRHKASPVVFFFTRPTTE